MIKAIVKKITTVSQRNAVRKFYKDMKGWLYFTDLNKLATHFGTDKWGSHYYTPHYAFHFRKFKFKKVNLLEIGVGGWEGPLTGGGSLRMWKKYFPFGNIFSIDIHDKTALQENRITIMQGSQTDEIFLDRLLEKMGVPDIIIDDGSHVNEHVLTTFRLLFPKLRSGGIYVIEDVQTSYWENYGGSTRPDKLTIMNFFKDLADGLNYEEIEGKEPSYYNRNITSIQFYHNLIFIYKGENAEGSNFIGK